MNNQMSHDIYKLSGDTRKREMEEIHYSKIDDELYGFVSVTE